MTGSYSGQYRPTALSHRDKAISTMLSTDGSGLGGCMGRFGRSSVIEYFHCDSNKSAPITAKVLTKEMLSRKPHADKGTFPVKYAMITENCFVC